MADMEMIRSIGASICITIIVTGIFSILVPGKNMERTIQLAVGLFFLASIVQPIVNGDWRELLEWDSRQIETQIPELEDTVDNRVVTLTEEGLQRQGGGGRAPPGFSGRLQLCCREREFPRNKLGLLFILRRTTA